MWSIAFGLACGAVHAAPQADTLPPLSDTRLLDEVQRRAFRFFWDKADPATGLVNDRARNDGSDDYTVASIAATGYALAAMPLGAQHRWVSRGDAAERARTTLKFATEHMPNVHGWLYHFVDKRTGERVWNCEVSTIDTCLLVAGALACGRYFGGDVEKLADTLYDRLEWPWVRTNDGSHPDKLTVSMGWKPEDGFLSSEWDSYCELPLIYLLGMGAKRNPLPARSWEAWRRPIYHYAGMDMLAGGPIFVHEMPWLYYGVKDYRDAEGWDYWASSANAVRASRRFCEDHSDKRKTYGPDIWGLNASDGPKGYRAYGIPEPEDGTVSPTGAIAAIVFDAPVATAAARATYSRYGARIWGRYGFANAFNVDEDWYDPDVIGIDLGMALLAIENHRSGLVWHLMESLPSTVRAYKAAGLHKTKEAGPRPLRRAAGPA